MLQVRLQDGRTFTGIVEDVDVKSDLATVRIPCKGLPVMPLGNSTSVRPGEFVIAMGSPLSLSNTITTGVVRSVVTCGEAYRSRRAFYCLSSQNLKIEKKTHIHLTPLGKVDFLGKS